MCSTGGLALWATAIPKTEWTKEGAMLRDSREAGPSQSWGHRRANRSLKKEYAHPQWLPGRRLNEEASTYPLPCFQIFSPGAISQLLAREAVVPGSSVSMFTYSKPELVDNRSRRMCLGNKESLSHRLLNSVSASRLQLKITHVTCFHWLVLRFFYPTSQVIWGTCSISL